MKRSIAVSLVVFLFCVYVCAGDPGSSGIRADSYPRVIRYTGKLSPEYAGRSGVGITFAFYAEQAGGSPLWVETQNVSIDASGCYSAVLGQGSVEGLPLDLFASNSARWLGVTVEGQDEQARVLLVSVPYALKAGDAETLGGFTATQIAAMAQAIAAPAQSGTAVTITPGRTGRTARGTASTDAPSQQRGTFFINGNSQVVIEAYDDGASSPLQLLLNPRGGNVGVNTAGPTSPLTVAGTIESTTGGFKFPDGSTQSTAALVTSFNGRTGAIAPAANDYSFGLLSGTLADSQLSGTYTGAVTLSNALSSFNGSFSGNGTALVGVLPASGSPNYVQNNPGTAQPASSFNIDGTGSASLFNSVTGYQVGGTQVLSASNGNLFVGKGAGGSNATGAGNTYVGKSAGADNNGNSNIYLGLNTGAGVTTESNTMRLGNAVGDSAIANTYIAGITGTTLNNGLLVFIDSNGKLGTGGSLTGVVTSFNGRGGDVVPTANDYDLSQISGTVSDSQLGGTYTKALIFSNATNSYAGTFNGSFSGNGSGLNGVLPAAGSPNYVQNNSGTPQPGTSFNIDGTASANVVNTATDYQIAGAAVLSSSGTNLFLGPSAGMVNTSGTGNLFAGASAGSANTTGMLNTYLGTSAGASNNGDNNVYLGNSAGQGAMTESNTIRLGNPNNISSTYIAGVNGTSLGSGSIVYVDANGKFGTGVNSSGFVTSFNGRSGAVSPASADYSFDLIGGSLGSTQLGGTYSSAVTFSNNGNAFIGNGSGLTGVLPAGGSTNYVQNTTTQQSGASFNIAGNGTLGGTLAANAVNTTTTYQMAGLVVLNTSDGNGNVFVGPEAGVSNIVETEGDPTSGGSSNTLLGVQSGFSNTSGNSNVFVGYQAGLMNATGNGNTFTGAGAGSTNVGGNRNTFTGYAAGMLNTSGSHNSMTGDFAGQSNTSGANNVFDGSSAGTTNNDGSNNTFVGYQAGFSNSGGANNTYIGYNAGVSNEGFSNIYIGDSAATGITAEDYTIRLGNPNIVTSTYIAGISGVTVADGIQVLVGSDGLMGTMTSSQRFKEDIHSMGAASSALLRLRPVSYYYKPEFDRSQRRSLQYGLIAEEVAKVYPELVAYGKDGMPLTVKYQYLAPMLLNELQKQHATVDEQQSVIELQQKQARRQENRIDSLQRENDEIRARLERIESLLEKTSAGVR